MSKEFRVWLCCYMYDSREPVNTIHYNGPYPDQPRIYSQHSRNQQGAERLAIFN